MSEAPDLAALARAWVDLWETGDLGAFDALHSDDFVDRSAAGRPTDRAGFKAGVVAMRAAFPDLRAWCEDVIVGADRGLVTVRWGASGTHRGAYLGFAPTGKTIAFRGIEIIRVVDGRVVERWGEWDGLDLVAQLRG